jgi:hypothetical protein
MGGVFTKLFKGAEAGSEFSRLSGFTEIQRGKNYALTAVKNISNDYKTNPQPKVAQAKVKGQQASKSNGQDINTTFPQANANANTVNKAINSSTAQKQQVDGEDYQADDSSSSIQMGAPKAGWCYIGEDRGFRTCAEVGVNDTCMSGNIFPSQQICVNPNLRS